MALAPGDVVGGFVIAGRLGAGGMGQVYRARDPQLDRDVALKLVDPSQLGAEGLLRFQREAELAARVDAVGGVVRVHARGVHRGAPFLVMELVEGQDLERLLSTGQVEPRRVAAIVEEVARTLEGCHALGVVHRDLKPANVLVRAADGAALLVDFGIARAVDADRLTRTGAMVGTPAYMAPEQALDASGAVDPRQDVYSLGAILYRALAGRPPADLLDRVTSDAAPPSSLTTTPVDSDLEAICLKAMARDPARRHPGAGALADDLARWRAGAPGFASSRRGGGGRRRVVVAGALAALLLLVALGGAHALARRSLERAARLEQDVVAALLEADGAPSGPVAADLAAAARDLERLRPLLGPADRRQAGDAIERLDACARLLDPGSAAPARPPTDAVARALDALVVRRRHGARAALRRLGATTGAPRARRVEARLRVETSPPAELLVWAKELRDEPGAWAVARAGARQHLLRACARAAEGSDSATQEAASLLALAAELEPALAAEAIEASASPWRDRLLQSLADERGREAALLARLGLLLGSAGARPGPSLTAVLDDLFLAQDARFREDIKSAERMQRLLDWDDAVGRLAPRYVPPAAHLQLLDTICAPRTLVGRRPRSFPIVVARRGLLLSEGFAFRELGQTVVEATEPPDAPADEPSAATRLAQAAYDVTLAVRTEVAPEAARDYTVASMLVNDALRPRLVAALERVLAAPTQDLSPRWEIEVLTLLAASQLQEAKAGPMDPSAARLAVTRARRALAIHVPDALLRDALATVIDQLAAPAGLSVDERIAGLAEATRQLRAAFPGARVGRLPSLRNDVAETTLLLARAHLQAGQLDGAVQAYRDLFDACPPPTADEVTLARLFADLPEPVAALDAFAAAFRSVDAALRDTGFVALVARRDLALGRRDAARALLARARPLAAADDPHIVAVEAELDAR